MSVALCFTGVEFDLFAESVTFGSQGETTTCGMFLKTVGTYSNLIYNNYVVFFRGAANIT